MDFSSIQEYLTNGLQLFLIYIVIYYILGFMRGTKAVAILTGFLLFILLYWTLAFTLELDVISWILERLWTIISLSVLVIFQPELRRVFAEIGTQPQQHASNYVTGTAQSKNTISTLTKAAFFLAERKIGALIAIERIIGMKNTIETGTIINTDLNTELLTTIFYPNTPLHDGGVVVKEGKLLAAGCIFPLSQNNEISRSLGTRHRAGVGITEETDCIAIIVSEETGKVSIAYMGHLARDVDEVRMRRHLTNYLIKDKDRDRVVKEIEGKVQGATNETVS